MQVSRLRGQPGGTEEWAISLDIPTVRPCDTELVNPTAPGRTHSRIACGKGCTNNYLATLIWHATFQEGDFSGTIIAALWPSH